MQPRQHVSAAILQLRRWVTIASSLVALCAVTQMFVFGFVHYTDVRWTKVQGSPDRKPLKVVKSALPPASLPLEAPRPGEPGTEVRPDVRVKDGRVVHVEETEEQKAAAAVDANIVRSGTDSMLHTTSDLAVTIGMVATCVLALLTMLGTIVAGGGAVPGIERVVTAATWSIVLAVVCIPWLDIFPSVPIPGVFGGYEKMAAASDAVRAAEKGGLVLAARYAVLPFIAMMCAACVGVWFRVGVERGIIVTSVSELEQLAEREMASINSQGVGGTQPRALGALYRAIGDTGEETPEPPAPPPPRMPLRRDAPMKVVNERPLGGVSPGEPLARPI
jgi:hypothetical protein